MPFEMPIPSAGLHFGADEAKNIPKASIFNADHTATADLPEGSGVPELHRDGEVTRDSIGPLSADGKLSSQQVKILRQVNHGGTKGIAVGKDGKLFRAMTPNEAYKEKGLLGGMKAYSAAGMRALGQLIHDRPAVAAAALTGTALLAAGIGKYETNQSYQQGQDAASGQFQPPPVPSYY